MYQEKLCAGNAPEKVMFALLSDVDLLKQLNEKARALLTDILVAQDLFELPECQRTEANLSRKLSKIRISLCEVIKGVFRFKRTPATHVSSDG